jgi:hypothetical protein
MTTITVTKRDGTSKTVQTSYTDATALDRLATYTSNRNHRLSRSEFACDLVRKSFVGNGLSLKQSKWVHVLAVEADTPRKQSTPGEERVGLKMPSTWQ